MCVTVESIPRISCDVSFICNLLGRKLVNSAASLNLCCSPIEEECGSAEMGHWFSLRSQVTALHIHMYIIIIICMTWI
jgi:hypothetical protein